MLALQLVACQYRHVNTTLKTTVTRARCSPPDDFTKHYSVKVPPTAYTSDLLVCTKAQPRRTTSASLFTLIVFGTLNITVSAATGRPGWALLACA